MTKQRLLIWVVMIIVIAGPAWPAHAAPAPKTPTPTVGQKAGAISALLPIATITRGAGKAAMTNPAKKGDDVVWNDLLKTQKGGRARITLTDQSILSLGSQSELRVIKHDDQSQQTSLQLVGGRVRAEVTKRTRQGGSFELKTPTAVAGVIGTDFGADSSSIGTTVFVCISGITQVSSSDPTVQGSVQCAAGLTTSVTAGKPPTIPTQATPQQIQQLIMDTEPAIISAMTPTTAMPGTAFDAAIGGSKLGAVNAVSVAPAAGVTASLSGTPTDSQVTVHLVLDANAAPGPHTLTLNKPNGAASAAVFTVLAPPTAAVSGDLKKPYHDLFDQERQSNKAGLMALIASVQQSVDQTLQQLQMANQGNVVDLGPATNTLNQQVTAIQNVINTAGGQVDQAVASALATFDSQYQLAWNGLLQRDPAGVPDDTFNAAVQAAYDQVNTSLGLAFGQINSSLNSNVQNATSTVSQLQQTWLSTIGSAETQAPTPAVNNADFSAFLGAAFGGGTIAAPDASRSKGTNGATIQRYQWVLCDSSYRPAQFGVPISATATGCNALSGYASSNADFPFPTCNLTAGDYIARVTVTDTNNQQAAMDVKIHVLAASYDDPQTRVLNLAASYGTLQVNQFLAFFDETNFSGFSSLSENVRNTFPLLSSMNINPRVSQTNISCNDATVRADWLQNYSYKANPNFAFSQSEQLSIRMLRTPGVGWKIYDFQGDNGTVQGQLPGPAVTTNPQPDLQVTAVFASYVGRGTSQSQIVPPGAQSFTAVVSNVGSADLSAATNVRIALLDNNGGILTSTDVPLTVPLAAGATQNVTAALNVPSSLAIGASFVVGANVNPGCSVPEANCDASNSGAQPLTVGTPVHLTQTATPTLISAGAVDVLTVTVDGPGTFGLVLPVGVVGCAPAPCALSAASPIFQTVTSANGGTLSWSLQAQSASVPGTALTTNVTFQGFNFPVTYAVTGQANYVVQSISFVGHTAPFTGGQGIQVGERLVINAVVANIGNVSPVGQITVAAFCSGGPPGNTACSNGGGSGNNDPITTIAAPAAGTAVTAVMTTGNNNSFVPGTYNGMVTLTTALAQSSTADDSLSLQFEAVDFNLSIVVPQGFFDPSLGGARQVRQSATALATPPPTQNVLLGGTAQISINLDETGNVTAFQLPVTVSTDNSGVSAPGVTVAPNSTVVTTISTSPNAAVPVNVTYSATNHGVTKTATQLLNYVSATFRPNNLFLNDANNPLKLQIGQTNSACVIVQGRPPAGCPANPDLTLVMDSTPSFDLGFGLSATVTQPSPVSGFTATVTPTFVSQGGTVDLQVSAAFGATPQVTSLPVTVTLPNSNPPANVTYTLFVQAIGVPDLQVVSATPLSRAISTNVPWLSGEGVDFTVVVRNAGNTASAGNEVLTMNLNGYQVDPGARGASVRAPALAPNTSTSLTVHAVAPDVGIGTFSSGTLVTKVEADTAGDLNYADNSLTQSVAVSNWRLAVSNQGGSDSAPLTVTITSSGSSWSNTALVTGTVDSGGTAGQAFNPVAGVVGSKLAITNFAQATGPSDFLVTVTTTDTTTQNGLYPAQVIVQMKDGGTVTAQRQATIHVQIDNFLIAAPNYTLGLTCTHNGASCVAGFGPATTIQVNGALTEPYIATVTTSCTPGPGVNCTGTADIVVTDATNTTTTPPQAKGQSFNAGAVFQVTANQDANGNISTGPGSGYTITVNGIQRSGATSPDAVGQAFSVPVNVGDIVITTNAGANACTAVAPNGPAVPLSVSWDTASMGGFNVPTISWEWQDANHSPIGSAPLNFGIASGSSGGGPNYANPPAFNLTNAPAGNTPPPDGLLLYFFAATVTNGTSSATKYFPFFFDVSLSQSFCGAAGGARGGVTRINGSWSRSAAGSGSGLVGTRLRTASVGSVDLHLSAADVSFSPSLPKFGDTVQVRFRVRNAGTADAKAVPIALQVNGVTVASDTFDVGAGRTSLGGLQWNSAAVPAAASTHPAAVRPDRVRTRGSNGQVVDTAAENIERPAGMARVAALLVIDPQHTIQQTTTLDKSAALAHFTMRSGDAVAGGAGAGPSQRVLLEIQDGACAGLRLTTGGVGPCGTADMELTIADIAKGTYTLNSEGGVADLGAAFAGAALGSPRLNSEMAATAGHSYLVQLAGGRTARVTVDSIRNPNQLDAATRAIFRNSATLVMRNLGSDSGPSAPGELAGGMRNFASVFVQLTVQVQ